MTYSLGTSFTRWASKNVFFARLLYAFSEVGRLGILLFLGFSVAPNLGINEFLIIAITVLPLVYVLLSRPESRKNVRTYFSQSLTLMLCSGLLFFSLGGLFSDKSPSFDGNYILANDVRTTLKTGTLQEIIEKQKSPTVYHQKLEKKKGNRKLLHILLFVLSLVLTYGGLILSCTLGCAGYTVFAWLGIITTLGFLGGGIFFLIKALSKRRPIGYRNLSKSQRKKEWKNFFLTWAGVVASALLALLIINI
ncbi:MAG: hypothetical protein ACI9IP_002867 [Arcticibacterium sp.]|jgi:hypothetical protein